MLIHSVSPVSVSGVDTIKAVYKYVSEPVSILPRGTLISENVIENCPLTIL